jgi:hypothetical protein
MDAKGGGGRGLRDGWKVVAVPSIADMPPPVRGPLRDVATIVPIAYTEAASGSDRKLPGDTAC